MAAKLFHDGLFIAKKGDESSKYLQDRIPEIAHKFFKKKQWRKQFYEAMRRVICRLAAGLGFRPNCIAEDAFVHVIINDAPQLGWKRIEQFTSPLPETDKDRDYTKVARLANEELGHLLKGAEAASGPKGGKGKGLDAKMDIKGWFKCYENSTTHMYDHIIKIEDDETDDWSVTTGSSSVSSGPSPLSSPMAMGLSPLALAAVHGGFDKLSSSPPRSNHRTRGLSSLSDLSADEAQSSGKAETDLSSLQFAMDPAPNV